MRACELGAARIAAGALAAALSACGGGGGSSPPIPGTFDTTFGKEGLAEFVAPGYEGQRAYANAVSPVPGGGVVLAGGAAPTFRSLSLESLFVRFGPGGGLDTTFGGTGFLRLPSDPTTGFREGRRALPADGGRMVAIDSGWNSCPPTPSCNMFDRTGTRVQRVDAGGAPDASFEVTERPLVESQSILEPGGGVLLLGRYFTGFADYAMGLHRLDPAGRPDASFASNVLAASRCQGTNSLESVTSTAMARQPDGRIVVARRSFLFDAASTPLPLCVFRIGRDGTLDPTYGTAGRTLIADSYLQRSEVVAVLPRREGGHVLVLNYHQGTTAFPSLVFLTQEGAVDATQGTLGQLVLNGLVRVAAAAVDGEGRFVFAGFRGDEPTAEWPYPWNRNDPRLVRTDPGGHSDDSFGNWAFGVVLLNPGGKSLQPNGIAIASDGAIYVAGFVGRLALSGRGDASTLAVAKLHGGSR